ncbi:hypothetical protein GCM10020369_08450 [Cryptosporangium minutisporangium]|uniref:Uncharacterized protein n=1 Tax=Cryptosporangium minutisporangium TaxID=113569 RepID=A0ABP6SSW4_9ACTN
MYTGSLDLVQAANELRELGEEIAGLWKVLVFAQEVNRTAPGTPPEIAAQTIGGQLVVSAVSITFDPTLPCPVNAQSTTVVDA